MRAGRCAAAPPLTFIRQHAGGDQAKPGGVAEQQRGGSGAAGGVLLRQWRRRCRTDEVRRVRHARQQVLRIRTFTGCRGRGQKRLNILDGVTFKSAHRDGHAFYTGRKSRSQTLSAHEGLTAAAAAAAAAAAQHACHAECMSSRNGSQWGPAIHPLPHLGSHVFLATSSKHPCPQQHAESLLAPS